MGNRDSALLLGKQLIQKVINDGKFKKTKIWKSSSIDRRGNEIGYRRVWLRNLRA